VHRALACTVYSVGRPVGKIIQVLEYILCGLGIGAWAVRHPDSD